MGVSDFYSLVRDVDPDWLALTCEGGYLWSLAAWTLFVFCLGAAAGALVGHLAWPGKPKPASGRALRRGEASRKRAAMRGFSRDEARAALRAFESGGMCELGESELAVVMSIRAGRRVFVLDPTADGGVTRPEDLYGVTNAWRAFLRDSPSDLDALRRLAS